MFSGFHKIPPQNSYFSNKYEFYFTLFFHYVNSKLTFLIRKVGKRISHRPYHFILAKLLKFQETFLEKFLVSGFGAEAPTNNEHKNAENPRFLIVVICLNYVPNLRFKGLFVKSPLKIRKNFAQKHHFTLAKLLRFQRTFHKKSLVSGVPRRIAPIDNAIPVLYPT